MTSFICSQNSACCPSQLSKWSGFIKTDSLECAIVIPLECWFSSTSYYETCITRREDKCINPIYELGQRACTVSVHEATSSSLLSVIRCHPMHITIGLNIRLSTCLCVWCVCLCVFVHRPECGQTSPFAVGAFSHASVCVDTPTGSGQLVAHIPVMPPISDQSAWVGVTVVFLVDAVRLMSSSTSTTSNYVYSLQCTHAHVSPAHRLYASQTALRLLFLWYFSIGSENLCVCVRRQNRYIWIWLCILHNRFVALVVGRVLKHRHYSGYGIVSFTCPCSCPSHCRPILLICMWVSEFATV